MKKSTTEKEFCPLDILLEESFKDLYKAIEKIDEKKYGSAKNFIKRYINSANV